MRMGVKSIMEAGARKGRKPDPTRGRRPLTTTPHENHSHYSETAWQICEHGQGKWLKMKMEAAEEKEE